MDDRTYEYLQMLRRQKQEYKAREKEFLKSQKTWIDKCLSVNTPDKSLSLIAGSRELMVYLFTHPGFAELSDTDRRSLALTCYKGPGFEVPEVLEVVSKLERRGKDSLPNQYKDLDEITVYRAGHERCLEDERYKIPWTLDIAEAQGYQLIRGHRHVCKARIRPSDIIACFGDEVLQYGSVYDIQLI